MHWWARLMMDVRYIEELRQRYTQCRMGVLRNDSVISYIDSQVILLGNAIGRNFSKWNILGTYIWPNSAVRNNYYAEIGFLKDWITRRIAWMDSQWLITNDSISEIFDIGINVYPNPVSGILNVKVPGMRECSI